MGKSYSKIEDKEVIIAQTAAGAGKNTATETETEAHVRTNNILLITLIVIVTIVFLGILYKLLKKHQKNEIEKQVQLQFVRRMRMRLSGRKACEEDSTA